jgi:rfaE bifunctional protein nucleotidyltransferase chain/domain
MEPVTHHLLRFDELPAIRAHARLEGKTIVATSGCFDLLHSGHIQFLENAKSQGDILVVGLNSDSSTRRVKGPGRPFLPENERALMLAGLQAVDHVHIFDELTPHRFLEVLKPDIYCKASDYTIDTLPERDVITANGGDIRLLTLKPGVSTSVLVSRILASLRADESPLPIEPHGQQAHWQLALEQLLANANSVRQSAYLFADVIERIVQRIVTAAPRSNVLIYGDDGSEATAISFVRELSHAVSMQHFPLTVAPVVAAPHRIASSSVNGGSQVVTFNETVGSNGDILIVLAPTGGSETATDLVKTARNTGLCIIVFTGPDQTTLCEPADFCLRVPAPNILTIQQVHLSLLQVICQRLIA